MGYELYRPKTFAGPDERIWTSAELGPLGYETSISLSTETWRVLLITELGPDGEHSWRLTDLQFYFSLCLNNAKIICMLPEPKTENQAPEEIAWGYPQPLPLNFSAYITFPLFFHLPQRFPLNTPLYPTTTIKYHFLYQLLIFYLLTITRGITAQCLGWWTVIR
jgi:hypothetical protein